MQAPCCLGNLSANPRFFPNEMLTFYKKAQGDGILGTSSKATVVESRPYFSPNINQRTRTSHPLQTPPRPLRQVPCVTH